MRTHYQKIIENYIHSYNSFDTEGMVKDLAEQVVFENISNGKVDLHLEGIGAFRKQAQSAVSYFKQREQSIQSWEFSDSIVTINIKYKAILAVDLPNGMNAGETLELKGSSQFEFENGKIKSIKDLSD